MMKCKICQLVVALFFSALCATLFGLSFLSASVVHAGEQWAALDYWCVWFCGMSFVAGIGCAIAAIVSTAAFLDGLCKSLDEWWKSSNA